MARHTRLTRREALARTAVAGALATPLAPAWAALERTPSQTEGPFYPVEWPAGTGNDLIHADDGGLAEGRPLALDGRVLDTGGRAVAGAVVEIWQCDNREVYRHPRDPGIGREDPRFRGFGASVTSTAGQYDFLTIVPVAYPGRPPHIHAKIRVDGRARLTTQLYLAKDPDNDRERLVSRAGRERLLIAPRPATVAGGLDGFTARFDFVL